MIRVVNSRFSYCLSKIVAKIHWNLCFKRKKIQISGGKLKQIDRKSVNFVRKSVFVIINTEKYRETKKKHSIDVWTWNRCNTFACLKNQMLLEWTSDSGVFSYWYFSTWLDRFFFLLSSVCPFSSSPLERQFSLCDYWKRKAK